MSTDDAVTGTWPAEAATVPVARRLVRRHLLNVGLDELIDSVELLISELVGNVVLHVGGEVTVTAKAQPGEVVIEVADGSSVVPHLRTYSETASTGRGMRLVHSLATEHGMRVTERGKVIWARVTTSGVRRDEHEVESAFADVDWLGELTGADAAHPPNGMPHPAPDVSRPSPGRSL